MKSICVKIVLFSLGFWLPDSHNFTNAQEKTTPKFRYPSSEEYTWSEFFRGIPTISWAFNPLLKFFTPGYSNLKYVSQKTEKSSKLMVVAHPDDESLWGGCALTESSGWHVISVTNASHPVRRREFSSAMNSIGASWEMWDHADQFWNMKFNPRLREDLSNVVKSRNWDQIVSHGPEGEYGHRQHKGLSKVMKEIVGDDLFVFHPFSKEKVDDRCIVAKRRLLDYYHSQKWTFDSVYTFGEGFGAEHEQLVRITDTL